MFLTSGLSRASRLEVYAYAIATVYALFLVSVYRSGTWIVDVKGVPIDTDFACAWAAALQAIQGQAALLYDPAKFVEMQAALVGASDYIYPNWPYPPTFLLILAPFAMLRYMYAFIVWDVTTLVSCVIVVYAIVRRSEAIALVLACPFTVWNFLAAQNGFLTASLLGGSLLCLERRPLLAGAFIGCLTYKPQFGVLFPVALVAAKQWRAIASALITATLLAVVSAAAFGAGVWAGFPGGVAAQTQLNLLGAGQSNWGYLQTIYGLIRTLHGGAPLAWSAQGLMAFGIALVVWRVWRSEVTFSLKAATLSAAALIATPYAFAYDMAAVTIPAAFLASDQLRCGSLKGEKTIMITMFGALVAALLTLRDPPDGVTFGGIPVGPVVVIMILGLTFRRVFQELRSSDGQGAPLTKPRLPAASHSR